MTFDISPRAVEDLCFSHNHLVIGLDEEGRAHAASLGRIRPQHLPYLVPGGRGTVRSNKANQDPSLKNRTWALFAIATGEFPLDRKPQHRAEGAQVRQIALPVPAGHDGGIFNRLTGSKEEIVRKACSLAEEIEATISANHGVAAKAFLRKVVRRRAKTKIKASKLINSFVTSVKADTDPWELRFARKFGVVFAAAWLLAKYKIAPWTKARARRGLVALYHEARRAIDAEPQSFKKILGLLAGAAAEGNKFPLVKRGQRSLETEMNLGFTKKKKGRRYLFVRPRRFAEMLDQATNSHGVLDMLARRKILVRGAGEKLTTQVLTERGRVRFICLDRKALLQAARAPT